MMKSPACKQPRSAFSLVEVVLAIGVLSLAIVALLGLFGPTIGSVKQVVDTNLATAAVSRINAEIQRGMTWDNALTATTGKHQFYIWKRQATPTSPVEFVMSGGSTNGSNQEAPVAGGNATLSSDLANGRLIDTPMLVTFQESSVNNYNYENNTANKTGPDYEGYFPIYVSIYAIDPNMAGSYTNVAAIEASLDPIFTYTTAKNRSL